MIKVDIGDVVLIDYVTFDKKIDTGIFVVMYHEATDIPTSNNFTAIKISSEKYCYSVPLMKKYLPFLHHNSFMNCNQQFRFLERQVKAVIGKITPYYFNKMYQQINSYIKSVSDILLVHIGQEELFEEFKK